MIDENTVWLLSFYRSSEIAGSLLFGRLARTVSDSAVQHDLSKHFADEAQHAWYWTRCIHELGAKPLQLELAYQDRYLAAAGMPANLMEVLALTQVFERRVIRQYALHSRVRGMPPAIRGTLAQIMQDEEWHIRWIRDALKVKAREYGAAAVDQALQRFTAADAEVYRATFEEHAGRLQHVFDPSRS
jgi:bacterioferritin (cytochrome b1)